MRRSTSLAVPIPCPSCGRPCVVTPLIDEPEVVDTRGDLSAVHGEIIGLITSCGHYVDTDEHVLRLGHRGPYLVRREPAA